jgi:hypothetical protein
MCRVRMMREEIVLDGQIAQPSSTIVNGARQLAFVSSETIRAMHDWPEAVDRLRTAGGSDERRGRCLTIWEEGRRVRYRHSQHGIGLNGAAAHLELFGRIASMLGLKGAT